MLVVINVYCTHGCQLLRVQIQMMGGGILELREERQGKQRESVICKADGKPWCSRDALSLFFYQNHPPDQAGLQGHWVWDCLPSRHFHGCTSTQSPSMSLGLSSIPFLTAHTHVVTPR